MKWINDRHPEFGQKVLVYCGGDDVQMACYDGDYIGIDGCRIDFVSHWTEIELPLTPPRSEDPCKGCRWQLSWDETESRAAEVSERTRGEYTAEDALCDNEMEHCIPCRERDD